MRVAKSEEMRNRLKTILSGVDQGKGDILSEVIRQGAGIIVQELLEGEVGEFLGRGHYKRSKDEGIKGYRNGYEPLRIKTGEGRIEAFMPQVRGTEDSFQSKLGTFFKGNSEVLEKLSIEMYVRGLSTRDIEDALGEISGDILLNRSAVSKITDVLNEDFQAFQARDLSGYPLEYLFLDAVFEPLKGYDSSQAILCAWGITRDEKKVLLHLSLGNKESCENWLEFLRDMVKRGIRIPTSITSDGALGAIQAIERMFPNSLRLRCWFHRMQNFYQKVPEEKWLEVKVELLDIRDSINYETAKQKSHQFIEKYKNIYPSLIKAFQEDLEALLNHLKLPWPHRINVRTTNLIERSFVEEKRRTKIIPSKLTEKALLKLVFSVLIRASKRWAKIKFSKTDIFLLDQLRKNLNITIDNYNEKKLEKVS